MNAGDGFELRELDVDVLRRRPAPSDEGQLQAVGVLLEASGSIELAHALNRLLVAGELGRARELVEAAREALDGSLRSLGDRVADAFERELLRAEERWPSS